MFSLSEEAPLPPDLQPHYLELYRALKELVRNSCAQTYNDGRNGILIKCVICGSEWRLGEAVKCMEDCALIKARRVLKACKDAATKQVE